MTLYLSKAGLDLITAFEGYHDAQPNGDCVAYKCPADKWTIGWGCTRDVHEGLRWTRQQAEDGLRLELEDDAETVRRLVTVKLNQNQFDALVSFVYNIGPTAFEQSTILKRINAGRFDLAEKEFARWNKHWDKATKKRVVSRGLQRRRGAEAAMFANDTLDVVAEPAVSRMPQDVKPPSTIWTVLAKARAWIIALPFMILEAFEGFVAGGFKVLMDVAAQVREFAPAKGVLLELGANAQSIGIALIGGSAVLVIGKLFKPDEVKE